MIVRFVASLRVGQLTLRSSPMVSFIYRRIAFGCWRVFFLTSFFATRYSLNKLISIFGYGQNAARIDGVARIQAGQAGIEPTTPGFGDRCSAKLSYWPIIIIFRCHAPGSDVLQPLSGTRRLVLYFVSRCKVCLRQREQNLLNSRRPGSLRRFFSVV